MGNQYERAQYGIMGKLSSMGVVLYTTKDYHKGVFPYVILDKDLKIVKTFNKWAEVTEWAGTNLDGGELK